MSVRLRFASALYAARTKQQLTQEKTAELLGISTRWYQKIEKGVSEPNLTLVCNIQKQFELNLANCAEEEAIL